ncbi:glucosaminidase domain-containing protein [Colwelliaceae bacterium BS250]
MYKVKKILTLSIISASLMMAGCSEASNPGVEKSVDAQQATKKTTEQETYEEIIAEAMVNPTVVEIGSLDDLFHLFELHQYDSNSWANGNREVPRISFDEISESWKVNSAKMTVQQKKQIFFRLITPLILISNERILLEREEVESSSLDSQNLKEIALKYHVIKSDKDVMTEDMRTALLMQVDIIPPSLALAQAAEESGWGTSRFTSEGNALFGQWDFSGNGMTPKQQRKELGDYGLARFDSPLASVEGYMKNINTTGAYQRLRVLRAQLRADGKDITGMEIAGTLDKYSERGQAYIDGLREMISYNKLQDVDEAFLSTEKLLHLVKK